MNYRKVLKVVLGLALLAVLFYIADIQSLVRNLSKADPTFYLAGVGLFLTTYAAASLRWRVLSRSIGYDLSLTDAFRIIAVSYSFNKLFPGNTGDIVRSKIFERYREVESHGKILGAVALERYFTVVSLLTIVAVALFFLQLPVLGNLKWVLFLFTALATAFSVLLVIDDRFLETAEQLVPFGSDFLSEVLEGYRSCSRGQLAANAVYSLYIRTAEAVVFYFFILSLSSGIGFWEGAFVTSMMSLVSALPISPGGIGAVESAGAGMLVFIGMSYTAALSLVVLQRSVGLVLMALIGVIVYWVDEYVS